ncbi:hypothetical protein [Umezawaea tangerina]|uniref:Uncharacterized protein n=1 Tax=Umezawaea tangerina TaxID=84725 RepID=A0A2T0SPI1_9PSEU|nr:hypothetical protein [Umezawaea tangerina]PRY35332.1 hypothetical protein CLV43_114250 [Umezawaea tangerina]
MTNEVKIIFTSEDRTAAGFAAARANASKAGKEAADAFNLEIIKGTKGTGAKVSKQVAADITAGAKGSGEKMGRQVTQGLIASTKDAGERAGKKFSDGFSSATKGLGNTTGREIDSSITASTKGTGAKVGKQISKDVSSNLKYKFNSSAAESLEKSVKGAFYGVGGALGAQAGGIGLAVGAGLVGGLSVALSAGGAVGLAAFFLKDNEKVSKAWGDTWKGISEDATRRAGLLEDEFVDGAKHVADAWDNSLGPSLERIFRNAEPLVDDFIQMPIGWLEELAPGIEKAVKNAGPVVEGLGSLGDKVFGAIGDGIGDLSEKAPDMKVAFELAGDGAAAAFKGFFGVLGDISTWTADNQTEIRTWGATVSKIAGEATDEIGRIAAAAINPMGRDPENKAKNAAGQPSVTNLEKALGGENVPAQGSKEAQEQLWYDIRDIPGDARKAAAAIADMLDLRSPMYQGKVDTHVPVGTDRGIGDTSSQTGYPRVIPPTAAKGNDLGAGVQRGPDLLTFTQAQVNAAQSTRDFNTVLDENNRLMDLGVLSAQQATAEGGNLVAAQQSLVETGTALTASTGSNTEANQMYIGAIQQMSAAGLEASDSLLNTVSGMNSAELAALGATVRTDGLGNSIVSIPGQKDITINAATTAAQDAISAVQGAVNALTGKTVYVNVVTTGVTTAANAVAAAANNARAALGYNDGGLIPGNGPDVDSVPIMATPQEFMVNREATAKHLPLLQAINEGAGGDAVMALANQGGTSRTGGGVALMDRPVRGEDGSSGNGAQPTILVQPQLNFDFGAAPRGLFDQRVFIAWIAEALKNNGGMNANGWKQ